MPFFSPISSGNHSDCWRDIEEALKLLSIKTSLKFAPCDRRWRHIGQRKMESGEKQIVLFDLADLVEAGGNADADVEAHMQTLRDRLMASVEAPAGTSFVPPAL